MRKKFEAGFKAKVALEAFRGEKTLSELSSEYGVHPNRIARWKKELIAGAGGIFGAAVKKPDKSQQEQIDKLYRNIGELKVENGLKKIRSFGVKQRQVLIDKQDRRYSVRRQCQFLGLNRTSLYYEPVGLSEWDRKLMNLLDQQYTETPFWGVRNMTRYLRTLGYQVGRDHVRTLLRKMGLEAVFAKPNLSRSCRAHVVYPYLLRDVIVTRPNQVWCADITYIRLDYGFAYLMAVMDWYSRCVLAWRLSNTLDSVFCVDALEEAVRNYGRPEIFNTDQGSQFTDQKFIGVLVQQGISISMDGKGRTSDNIFVERLWQTEIRERVPERIPEYPGSPRGTGVVF